MSDPSGLLEEERASAEDDGFENEDEVEAEEAFEDGDEQEGEAEEDPSGGAQGIAVSGGEINVDSFEDININSDWTRDAQDAWKTFVNSSASKEACADAIYGALFEASPAMQYLFTSPRAIAAGRFFAGIHNFVHGLSDPSALKGAVETLAFGHLALEINIPRVVLFRDALLDLFQVELGSKLTSAGYQGLKALLNYVGGAIIYIKVYYNARIILLGESWALANDKTSNNNKFATLGSIEVKKDAAEGTGAEAGGEKVETDGSHDHKSGFMVQNVPTTFKEMFQFNAAVMGFGANVWMNEVLACFENVVLNVANPSRLNEECDFMVVRISKVATGKVNLTEFKSGMLASLRSLLPKDWTTQHEVAWSWLWDLVERAITQNLGKPQQWERAYAKFLENLDEASGFNLRRDIYLRFFALAPAGQDYFKQSNTYLHLVSTKVLTMVLDLYRDPVRMVDDISGVGLRHVGYGVATEFFAPFASATAEAIGSLTSDETCIAGFNWSMGLISKSAVRTIIEGSTLVMKAVNLNTKKATNKALAVASRGERSGWMLLIQVGSQNISPLAWSIESGALESASAMLVDLLTIRADRDRYYYACDELMVRHSNLVQMLLQDAPGLLPELFDGMVWRSRVTRNGMRRVNYYIKHLLVDSEGRFAKTLDWVIKAKDPKIVCHPVLVILSDTVWAQVACRTFLIRKLWFLFTLCVFIISQAVLSKLTKTATLRITVGIARAFIYVFSMGGMIFNHMNKCIMGYRSGDVVKFMNVFPVPKYLENFQDFGSFFLLLSLLGMVCTEPILYCLSHANEELFTDTCDETTDIRMLNSEISMFAVFLYYLLLVDLAVFSNRVSAYALVCARMLSEFSLFVLALTIVLGAFSSGMSCLQQKKVEEFHGISMSVVSLWEIFLNVFSDIHYSHMRYEPVLLIGAFLFLITSLILISSLLIAQLTCAYDTIYSDMVGYARIKRIQMIVESMPQVPPKRWGRFVASLAFDKKIEFNEGDVGVNNGIATLELASTHPTTVDTIKRFGGSTSPDMQWPQEDNGTDESDRFERLELLIKRAMERATKVGGGEKKHRGAASTSGSAGAVGASGASGSEGVHESEGMEEEAQHE